MPKPKKAMVKCKFCGEIFDRNDPNIEVVQMKTRYAHKACYEQQNREALQELEDWEDLVKYVSDLLGDDFNFVKTKRLLEKYKTDYKFSYSGMLKALKWFYEINNGSKENAHGAVGILPYIYEEAYKYYFEIYQKQQKNAEAAPYQIVTQTITIPSPRMYVAPPRLFDLGED